MTKPVVETSNTFDEWRQSTNLISDNVGDPADVFTSPVATTGVPQNTQPADVILALNNLEERKANEIDPSFSGTLTVTGDVVVTTGDITGDGAGLSNLNASNLATGTVSVDRIGTSGTRDTTTILIGNNTWQNKSEFVTELNLATNASATDSALALVIALG